MCASALPTLRGPPSLLDVVKVKCICCSITDAPVDVVICSVGPRMSCDRGMARALLDRYKAILEPYVRKFWNSSMRLNHGEVRVLKNVDAVGGSLKHVVFTHGPKQSEFGRGNGLETCLKGAFLNSLRAAVNLKEESIAIPAISAGSGGVDLHTVVSIMTSTVAEFLATEADAHHLRTIVFIDTDNSVVDLIKRYWEQMMQSRTITPPASVPISTAASSTAGASALSPIAGDKCPICLERIANGKGSILACRHVLCKDCYDTCSKMNPVCPVCRKAFRKLKGNQPSDGKMKVMRDGNTKLPGFENYGTIIIDYIFRDGMQTAEHPNPGQTYHGTHRRAYLPDNGQGQHGLKLLQDAFAARLTFTVGTSLTSGRTNRVTWNDIHHKTSIDGGPENYGYPDPTYLQRLLEDLAAKGIV